MAPAATVLNAEMTPSAPKLSLIVPTYNERSNIAPLVDSVRNALADIAWEIVFVDDDSPDGTYDEVNRIAQGEPRVRCLRRVGRRGLSSAVIEGMLVANASVIAVMDADFQHDESKLPEMYSRLISEDADIVIGTRYGEGGSIGPELNAAVNPLEYRDPDWLRTWIEEPSRIRPGTRMPPINPALPDRARTIDQILAYLGAMAAARRDVRDP